MKKAIVVVLTLGLMGLSPVSPAQANCSKNVGHCSVKYTAKNGKYCKPSCFKGTNSRGGWGR
jgi:hypothetical protein